MSIYLNAVVANLLLLLTLGASNSFAAINNLDSAATLPDNLYSNTASQIMPNTPSRQATQSSAANNPLAQLPPLHRPAPINWWPLAPGWWLLALITTAAVIGALLILWQYYTARRLKRLARTELQQLYLRYQHDHNSNHYLLHSNQLLRRFCMQQFPFTNIAAVHGEPWLKYLDVIAHNTFFQSDCGRQLLAIYLPPEQQTLDIEALHLLILKWLKAINPSHSIARQSLRNNAGKPS